MNFLPSQHQTILIRQRTLQCLSMILYTHKPSANTFHIEKHIFISFFISADNSFYVIGFFNKLTYLHISATINSALLFYYFAYKLQWTMQARHSLYCRQQVVKPKSSRDSIHIFKIWKWRSSRWLKGNRSGTSKSILSSLYPPCFHSFRPWHLLNVLPPPHPTTTVYNSTPPVLS